MSPERGIVAVMKALRRYMAETPDSRTALGGDIVSWEITRSSMACRRCTDLRISRLSGCGGCGRSGSGDGGRLRAATRLPRGVEDLHSVVDEVIAGMEGGGDDDTAEPTPAEGLSRVSGGG